MKLWEYALKFEQEIKYNNEITYEIMINHRCISMYEDLDSIVYLFSKWKYDNCHWDENGMHRSCKECWDREYIETIADKDNVTKMDKYCEYIHDDCEYVTVCKNLENICVKDILGKDLFNKLGYKPEDILERIERNKYKKDLTI